MTPWELAKDTEHSQQRALFGWANCAALYGWRAASMPAGYKLETRSGFQQMIPVPELALLFAIHNQGHGDRIRGAQAKAEGVKAGVPDVLLPVSRTHAAAPPYSHITETYHGLFIEMKKLKKGVISEDQKDWSIALSEQGYAVSFCKGWIEAANTISGYLGSEVRVS